MMRESLPLFVLHLEKTREHAYTFLLPCSELVLMQRIRKQTWTRTKNSMSTGPNFLALLEKHPWPMTPVLTDSSLLWLPIRSEYICQQLPESNPSRSILTIKLVPRGEGSLLTAPQAEKMPCLQLCFKTNQELLSFLEMNGCTQCHRSFCQSLSVSLQREPRFASPPGLWALPHSTSPLQEAAHLVSRRGMTSIFLKHLRTFHNML